MTLLPNSSISANGGDINTLEVTTANETVFVRSTVYLVADGNGSDAIEVASNANTLLIAGSLAADEGNALNLVGANNEVAISATGNLVSGNDAIYGDSSNNIITNDGTILGGGSGIDMRYGSLTSSPQVTNNGSITGYSDAVILFEGGIFNNTGSVVSGNGDGVYFGNYNGSDGNSVLTNSGLINGDVHGAAFNGENVSVTNSGLITGFNDGMNLSSLTDDVTVTNSGEITGLSNGIFSGGTDGVYSNSGDITGGSRGIYLTDGHNEVTNEGRIVGGITGENDLVITNSGEITGTDNGIYATSLSGTYTGTGNHLVTNSGAISGTSALGVYLQGTNSAVVNAAGGTITSQESQAILIEGLDAIVSNAGLIQSVLGHAVNFHNFGEATGGAQLINAETGIIIGGIDSPDVAVSGSSSSDIIQNAGLIEGGVLMGSGGDFYEGIGDGVVLGAVSGSTGDDTLLGSAANDDFLGGGDNDYLVGRDGEDLLLGESGMDTLRGGGGDDDIDGGDDDDEIHGGSGHDMIVGGSGADLVYGDSGDDTITTGSFEDTVFGGSGDDDIDAGSNADDVSGGSGDDVLRGGTGGDTISGGSGDDIIAGNSGHDDINGGSGADEIFGGENDDTIAGTLGDDYLDGGTDDDMLYGGSDNDTLVGGAGQDTLSGGNGADVFVFGEVDDSPHGADRDVITDFEAGIDMIDLSGFGGLTFVAGYTGSAGEVRYNDGVGRLYIDIDGDMASDFSVDLTGTPALTADDLIL